MKRSLFHTFDIAANKVLITFCVQLLYNYTTIKKVVKFQSSKDGSNFVYEKVAICKSHILKLTHAHTQMHTHKCTHAHTFN